MITIEKNFSFREFYPLARLGMREELLFFDIETTGFSADSNTVYLIGCITFTGDSAHLIQWFADTKDAESDILEHFCAFAKDYRVLIHFNGDTFDLPFLRKRCHLYGLSSDFDSLTSIDIYKKIKPWKKHLCLPNLKQKSIETFLGICRADQYSGGELIEVYQTYLKTQEQSLLHLLLLHNEDDLKGMPGLLPILFYPDFFAQKFVLENVHMDSSLKQPEQPPIVHLTLMGDEALCLPVPIERFTASFYMRASKNQLQLSIQLYEGTLKYYYPNPKDYYYLPYEDTAIHKSVAEYVDKDAKVKATKETCYAKKNGWFVPQPEPLWSPVFKNNCRDKTGFFEYCPDCFSNFDLLNRYLQSIFKIC